MTPRPLGISWCASVALLVAGAWFPARAQVVPTEPSASLALPATQTPDTLSTGDFSVWAWIWRDPADTDLPTRVLALPGAFELGLNGPKGVEFTLRRKDGRLLTVRTQRAVPRGVWTLIVASYARTSGDVRVWSASAGTAVSEGGVTDALWSGPVLATATAGLTLGASGGAPAMLGTYGVMVVRDEPADADAVRDAFDSRRAFAAYASDTQSATAAGSERCALMLNHAVQTSAIGFLPDGASPAPAVAGGPVLIDNYQVFRGDLLGADHSTAMLAAHGLESAQGFVFAGEGAAHDTGFFVADMPRLADEDFAPYAGVAPSTRLLATNSPDRPIRVMVSGNSRAVQRDDGTGDAPGNWMHGFAAALGATVSGSMLRPLHSEGGEGHNWLAFDARGGVYRTGLVEPLDWDGPWIGFTRFWSGSAFGEGIAAGSGVRIAPGVSYALRSTEEAGTQLRADAPLTLDALVLRYPGSSTLRWRVARAESSSGPPVAPGLWTWVELDSTVASESLGAGDVVSASELVVSLATAALIEPGHACFVGSGPGPGFGAVSVVASVTVGTTDAVVTLSHPLPRMPGSGSVVRFGPWSVERIEALADAVQSGDTARLRGIELQAQADSGGGVIAFAVGAERADVAGFVLGAGGWGGHGYDEQIAGAVPGALAAWAGASRADVWVLTPAQQASEPESMSAMTGLIRGALPGAEVVWAHDIEHDFGNPLIEWHRYVRDNGHEADAALSLLYDPELGSWPEHLRRGLRKNGGHMNSLGAQRAAERWLDGLRRATASACAADITGDGRVDANDFFAFLADFAANRPAADMNNDGTVNSNDFFAFLAAFQAGC